MIKKIKRLPDKLEDLLEEINVEEGKGKGKMKKAVVYFNNKLKYVKGKRKFSKGFEELVLDCLSSKESKRPSVGDLLQRPFFRYAKNLQLVSTPRVIKIKITSYEVEAGALLIPYIETFEYILRYWTLNLAKILVNGCGVCVQMWDVAADSAPKKYEGERVYLWKLCNDDYALSCIELFNSSRLGVGDEIGLFWDPRSSNFMFKLLSQVTII
uniref:B3 domain-containing protein n=1 Tax=Solanum tuberosum TaxID=4113 RepID=M1A9X6_SOLTU